MIHERILTAVTWFAVLAMMLVVCEGLARQFDPENVYPKPPSTKYTDGAFKALEYENAQNKYGRTKAERFIQSIADGKLR